MTLRWPKNHRPASRRGSVPALNFGPTFQVAGTTVELCSLCRDGGPSRSVGNSGGQGHPASDDFPPGGVSSGGEYSGFRSIRAGDAGTGAGTFRALCSPGVGGHQCEREHKKLASQQRRCE